MNGCLALSRQMTGGGMGGIQLPHTPPDYSRLLGNGAPMNCCNSHHHIIPDIHGGGIAPSETTRLLQTDRAGKGHFCQVDTTRWLKTDKKGGGGHCGNRYCQMTPDTGEGGGGHCCDFMGPLVLFSIHKIFSRYCMYNIGRCRLLKC
jgi:hypothetical protein